MAFVWNRDLFNHDHTPPIFPGAYLSRVYSSENVKTSAKGPAASFRQAADPILVALFWRYDTTKAFRVLGSATSIEPGNTIGAPEFHKTLEEIYTKISSQDRANIAELLELSILRPTKHNRPMGFDLVQSLTSPISGFGFLRMTLIPVDSCVTLLVAVPVRDKRTFPLNFSQFMDVLRMTIEERDSELAIRCVIPSFSDKSVVEFPSDLQFHRHAKILAADRIHFVERLYSYGYETIHCTQTPLEEIDDETFRLRARIRGLSKKKSDALVRGLCQEISRDIDVMANAIQVDVGLYVGNLDRVGAISIPMPTLRRYRTNHFTTLTKRASLKLPQFPFVSESFRYTEFWNSAAAALTVEAFPLVLAKLGKTAETQYVVPVWEFSKFRRQVFQRGRVNDPVLVDPRADVGFIVLRDYAPETSEALADMSLSWDLKALGVPADPPEVMTTALDRL